MACPKVGHGWVDVCVEPSERLDDEPFQGQARKWGLMNSIFFGVWPTFFLRFCSCLAISEVGCKNLAKGPADSGSSEKLDMSKRASQRSFDICTVVPVCD